MAKPWNVDSWRGLPIRHQPTYGDSTAQESVEAQIKSFPPLVFAGEARKLRARLGEAANGRAFWAPEMILESIVSQPKFRMIVMPRGVWTTSG